MKDINIRKRSRKSIDCDGQDDLQAMYEMVDKYREDLSGDQTETAFYRKQQDMGGDRYCSGFGQACIT